MNPNYTKIVKNSSILSFLLSLFLIKSCIGLALPFIIRVLIFFGIPILVVIVVAFVLGILKSLLFLLIPERIREPMKVEINSFYGKCKRHWVVATSCLVSVLVSAGIYVYFYLDRPIGIAERDGERLLKSLCEAYSNHDVLSMKESIQQYYDFYYDVSPKEQGRFYESYDEAAINVLDDLSEETYKDFVSMLDDAESYKLKTIHMLSGRRE